MTTGQKKQLHKLQHVPGTLLSKSGNLNRLDAVVMKRHSHQGPLYRQWSPYMVHLSVTGRCNARCQGCINGSVTFRDQSGQAHLSREFDLQPTRDAQAVYELLQKDGADEAVVCFYGGEPLLKPEAIAETILQLDKKCKLRRLYYMLYTNGLLLDKTADQWKSLLSKFWLVSISIDGRTDQHNRIRTGADLDAIHRNLKKAQPLLNGHVLMWSTLRESQSLKDCFEEFLHLEERGQAGLWFWHWVEAEEPFEDFETFCRNYERDLKCVLDVYVDRLKSDRPLSIIHLDELVLFLMTGTCRDGTGCGVEQHRNYDIVGGKILACADLGMEWEMGSVDPEGHAHLGTFDFTELIDYKKTLGCYDCGVHAYCGGRCPVEALYSTRQRMAEYCRLMRLHVGVVQQYMPRIAVALKQQNISIQQLYDRSAKYAQFTDVTP